MFEKNFCSSPWFHFRISYDGTYQPCRWALTPEKKHNIQSTTPVEFYNSQQMRDLRSSLLDGKLPDICKTCNYEESFDKLNGRRRQLAKSAVDTKNFFQTFRSSPHFDIFKFSYNNKGASNYKVADLQIDLGNLCNSACIMCSPIASSRLEADYIKLNVIDNNLFNKPTIYKSWTQNDKAVNRLIEYLSSNSNIKYIHFLGGETLYDQTFYKICDELIDKNLAQNIIIGTTTNGTIYNSKIKKYIENFKEFHLGVSIETVDNLNDYIRYPGKISVILDNLNKFLQDRISNNNFFVQLRITPNIFSMYNIDNMFEFMIENKVIAESCNILFEPQYLRIELIPNDIRSEIIHKLEVLINKYNLNSVKIVNIRRTDLVDKVIADVIIDYYNFLKNYDVPTDAEKLRFDLVKFLKSFESIRNNCILDYAPRYEKFLRSYGY